MHGSLASKSCCHRSDSATETRRQIMSWSLLKTSGICHVRKRCMAGQPVYNYKANPVQLAPYATASVLSSSSETQCMQSSHRTYSSVFRSSYKEGGNVPPTLIIRNSCDNKMQFLSKNMPEI